MESDVNALVKLVNKALDLVYERDCHLVSNKAISRIGKDEHHHVGERSIVFRFAHYLQNLLDENGLFESYNLDCEYNRNGAETKQLPSFPGGTYPDVILHHRGSNDSNLLVIEFKSYWNQNQSNDIKKIKEFTNPTGVYRFKLGMTILLGKTRGEVVVNMYCNGFRFPLNEKME